MSNALKTKLRKLQTDYTGNVGRPFNHFFCPILFQDEKAELCKAHIINRQFEGSSRAWTVQRKDVDSFYGSHFEADFILMRYATRRGRAEIFGDKDIQKKLPPKILLDDQPVDYFHIDGEIPAQFTPVEFEENGRIIPVALKMSPESVLASMDRTWETDTTKDLRLPALVSLIKAAYLTLFEMLGYRYVLSRSGEFVGNQILGEFFRRNQWGTTSAVLEHAASFFSEFVHMVRPVVSQGHGFQGTISDRKLHICWDSRVPWALVVYVRTGNMLHAVMLPISDEANKLKTYLDFLKNDNESISVTPCHLERRTALMTMDREPTRMQWLKTGLFYP